MVSLHLQKQMITAAKGPAEPGCAGVVVFLLHKVEPKVAIVLQDGGQNHSFPKGKREKGESLPKTAVRELQEETSLTEKDVRLLPWSEYIDEVKPNGRVSVRYWVAEYIAGKEDKTEPKLAAQDPTEI